MARHLILGNNRSFALGCSPLLGRQTIKTVVWLSFLFLLLPVVAAKAQTAPSVPPKLGTVQAVSGNTVTLTPDTGSMVTITMPDTAKVQQLAVGSTDLKTAKPSQFSDIAVGDRILAAVGTTEAPDSFVARQVILMKHTAIAEMQAAQQADWAARGVGGIVNSVDAVNGAITLTSGAKKVVVHTTGKTEFKRFSSGGVGAYGGGGASGMRRSAGADLAQMMEHLPSGTLANLKTDDAVMIVASEPSPEASTVSAITLLSGVEPILTANPNGGMDLSMNLGSTGGGGE
jgi:hypothetical protein